ncbi:MAG: hypothetical protein LBI74_05580 [Synergistaceae bacterium]|nr:hypothetical protein [Synergistaceae bacterium]
MRRSRKIFFMLVVILPICLLIISHQILSGVTFGAGLVLSKFQGALGDIGGYELTVENAKGNPVTGVILTTAAVSRGGDKIAEIGELELNLDLLSLLSSSPKLSVLAISGLKANYDDLAGSLPARKEGQSAPPALARLVLRDSEIETRGGLFSISGAQIDLGENAYKIDLSGRFAEDEIVLSGRIEILGKEILAEELELSFGDLTVSGGGMISPSVDFLCDVDRFDAALISRLISSFNSKIVSGVYSGKIRVKYSQSDGFSAGGNISSPNGSIWVIPFSSLESQVSYSGNKFIFSDVRSKIFGADLSGIASVSLQQGNVPRLSLRLQMESLKTREAASVFKWLDSLSGDLDYISCDLSGPINSISGPVRIVSSKATAQNIEFSDFRARIVVKESARIGVEAAAGVFGSKMRASGGVRLAPDIGVDMDLSLSSLSLDELGKKFQKISDLGISGAGDVRAKVTGSPASPIVSGSLRFDSMKIRDVNSCEDVDANFVYSSEGISISSASAKLNGARVSVKGSQRQGRAGESSEIDFKGSLSGLKLGALSAFIPQITKLSVNGTVSGEWNVSGSTENPIAGVNLRMPSLGILGRVELDDVKLNAEGGMDSIQIKSLSARYGDTPLGASGSITPPAGDRPMAYDIKGSFRNFNPSYLVKAGIISGDISGDLVGDMRLWSNGGAVPSVRVFFKDSNLRYSNRASISDLNGAVTLSDGNLKFEKLRTITNSGYIGIDGTVGNVMNGVASPEKMPLSIRATISSADIGRVSRIFLPASKGFQGTISGSGDITGTVASPKFSGSASLLSVRAMGLFLPFVRFDDVSGDLSEIKFPSVRAVVGRGFIRAEGAIVSKSGTLNANVKATGRSVDIRSLTYSLDDSARKNISGSLFFDFEGGGSIDSFMGKGTVRIPNLTAMGLQLSDINAPFWVTDGFVLVEESTAKAYNGDVTFQIAKDLSLSNWGGRIEVKSADISNVLRDMMPDSEGSITGKAGLRFRVGGDVIRTSMQDGDGTLEIGDGEISGFSGATAVSKLIGGRPLRFQSVSLPFSLDGRTLYILPGARIAAPQEDPAYKYVMIDGSIGIEDRNFSMSCVGNVNIRALNAFAAGMQGVLSAAMTSDAGTESIIQNFLGGAITGFSKNEFRDISMVVDGRSGDIKFNKVVVAEPVKTEMMPEKLSEIREGSAKEKEKEKIQIKLEFPTGPGGKRRGDGDVKGQVGGQVLEQAIKGVLSF